MTFRMQRSKQKAQINNGSTCYAGDKPNLKTQTAEVKNWNLPVNNSSKEYNFSSSDNIVTHAHKSMGC